MYVTVYITGFSLLVGRGEKSPRPAKNLLIYSFALFGIKSGKLKKNSNKILKPR